MALRKLKKPEWRRFCDTLTKVLEGKQAEIEVASLDLGDQIAAEWTPFLGIAFDPKNDLFEIILENVDHLIRNPQELTADIGATGGLAALAIVDADGRRQIIRFRDPPLLPAPQPAESRGGAPDGG